MIKLLYTNLSKSKMLSLKKKKRIFVFLIYLIGKRSKRTRMKRKYRSLVGFKEDYIL